MGPLSRLGLPIAGQVGRQFDFDLSSVSLEIVIGCSKPQRTEAFVAVFKMGITTPLCVLWAGSDLWSAPWDSLRTKSPWLIFHAAELHVTFRQRNPFLLFDLVDLWP